MLLKWMKSGQKRPDEVIEYCLRDAALPLDIMEEIQAIRRCEAIASVAGVTLDVVANGNTSQRLDALVIRAADKNKIAVPLPAQQTEKKAKFKEAMSMMLRLVCILGLLF